MSFALPSANPSIPLQASDVTPAWICECLKQRLPGAKDVEIVGEMDNSGTENGLLSVTIRYAL